MEKLIELEIIFSKIKSPKSLIFLIVLSLKRVFEVTHDRQANNDKELTVKAGELLEVLDDKRNWWRLRSFYGHVGHAPVTILREFNSASIPHPANSNNGNQYEANADKVGYF
jgi:hypothetical protein